MKTNEITITKGEFYMKGLQAIKNEGLKDILIREPALYMLHGLFGTALKFYVR